MILIGKRSCFLVLDSTWHKALVVDIKKGQIALPFC